MDKGGMTVDLEGLARALDDIREELEPYEDQVDHRAGYLWTAADCLRQAAELEAKYELALVLLRAAREVAERRGRELTRCRRTLQSRGAMLYGAPFDGGAMKESSNSRTGPEGQGDLEEGEF